MVGKIQLILTHPSYRSAIIISSNKKNNPFKNTEHDMILNDEFNDKTYLMRYNNDMVFSLVK